MRNLYFLSACALALSACSNPDAENRARFIAAGVDAITPKALGDGLTMTAARADKSTLIIAIEGVSSEEMALPDFEQQMRASVCSDEGLQKVTRDGVGIILNLTANDGRTSDVEVKSC